MTKKNKKLTFSKRLDNNIKSYSVFKKILLAKFIIILFIIFLKISLSLLLILFTFLSPLIHNMTSFVANIFSYIGSFIFFYIIKLTSYQVFIVEGIIVHIVNNILFFNIYKDEINNIEYLIAAEFYILCLSMMMAYLLGYITISIIMSFDINTGFICDFSEIIYECLEQN